MAIIIIIIHATINALAGIPTHLACNVDYIIKFDFAFDFIALVVVIVKSVEKVCMSMNPSSYNFELKTVRLNRLIVDSDGHRALSEMVKLDDVNCGIHDLILFIVNSIVALSTIVQLAKLEHPRVGCSSMRHCRLSCPSF